MGISVAERIAALVDGLTVDHLDTLPPARLRQLAVSLRHWGAICDQRAELRQRKRHRSGILSDLQNGNRGE